MSKWRDNKTPQYLIKTIKEELSVNKNGGVSFKIGTKIYVDALYSLVEHKHNLDSELLFEIFFNSVKDCYKKNLINDPNEILKKFDQEAQAKTKSKSKYVYIATINIEKQLKRRRINGCTITTRKKLDERFYKERNSLYSKHESKFSEKPENYSYIIVHLEAHDPKTAIKMALDVLDFYRAAIQLCFRANINFLSLYVEQEYLTESHVKLNDFHTLHYPNGKSADKLIWYESKKHLKPAVNFDSYNLDSQLSKVLDKYREHKFQKDIYSLMSLFIRALDHDDLEAKFMKLWSLIECITKSSDIKIIKKRASFLYDDREIMKEILESLRYSRHKNIHVGNKAVNIEIKNFFLFSFSDRLIKFLLVNITKSHSFDDFHKMADLPTELMTLNQQIKYLKKVKTFINQD